jgi:hypothetical protein
VPTRLAAIRECPGRMCGWKIVPPTTEFVIGITVLQHVDHIASQSDLDDDVTARDMKGGGETCGRVLLPHANLGHHHLIPRGYQGTPRCPDKIRRHMACGINPYGPKQP